MGVFFIQVVARLVWLYVKFGKERPCTCILGIEGNFTLQWWHYKAVFVIHTLHLCNVLCCPFEMLGENCRHDLHDGVIARD
jgi:hypothetical protein